MSRYTNLFTLSFFQAFVLLFNRDDSLCASFLGLLQTEKAL